MSLGPKIAAWKEEHTVAGPTPAIVTDVYLNDHSVWPDYILQDGDLPRFKEKQGVEINYLANDAGVGRGLVIEPTKV